MGSKTSHTAIVARSMDIPAVVGAREASRLIRQDDWLVIDGDSGTVIVDPPPAVIAEYRALKRQRDGARAGLKRLRHLPAVTRDGEDLNLTSVEVGLLYELLKEAGKVVKKDELSERVLERKLSPYDRSLDMHISNLRKKLGAKLIEVSLPNLGLSVPAYYVVAPAECSSNLSRFDGVRYCYRCDNPKDLLDLYKRSRGEGFGAEVKRRIMTGTYVLSAGYFDAYYLKAQKARRLITDDFRSAFEKVDLVIGPTTPTPAFDIGAKMNDPVLMYLNDIYTIGANLAGLPGVSVPCGLIDGLPMGLQLIGPHFAEAKLLNAAHQYQQATDWHAHAPGGYES